MTPATATKRVTVKPVTPTSLRVFDGIDIPVEDAVSQTYALLSRREGGKTYTTMLFEEQLCDAGVFFVTLDPVGKHWGLRAPAQGRKTGGKDVWVLGGRHGDIPLSPDSGKLIAETVVDHPGRYVLDLSLFDTDAEQDRFAAAFGERLFRHKAADPGWPLMLILEEAESFIPQVPQKEQTKMLGTYGKLMRQGRNHGIGMWLVSQRAQALNKGVLSQAEVLIVKQMAASRDRAAVDDWVKANGTQEERDQMMAALATLNRNEAFVWSPSWLRTFKRTRVPKRVTFDSSASAKAGVKHKQPTITPLDVKALGQQIEAMAEKIREDDPAALKREIQTLRRELTQERQRKAATASEPVIEYVEVPVADPELAAQIRAAREVVQDVQGTVAGIAKRLGGEVAEAVGALSEPLAKLTDAANRAGAGKAPSAPQKRAQAPARRSGAPAPAKPSQRPASASAGAPARANGNGERTPARQAILDTLADLESVGIMVPSKPQLALWCGVSPKSSGYRNNIGALRSDGMVEYPAGGTIQLTDQGRSEAGTQFPEGITTETLHARIERLLSAPRWRIVAEVIAAHPGVLSREELAARVEVSASSSGYRNNLGALRTLGIIDYPTGGSVAASATLFLEQ